MLDSIGRGERARPAGHGHDRNVWSGEADRHLFGGVGNAKPDRGKGFVPDLRQCPSGLLGSREAGQRVAVKAAISYGRAAPGHCILSNALHNSCKSLHIFVFHIYL